MSDNVERRPLDSVELVDFPLRTHEKLRYVDTDRQGHVNNAVFSSMLETGRVELLYDPDAPLAAPGCSFVIVRLTLDFGSEINWPGRVDIGTRIASIGRSSLTLEQGLFQGAPAPPRQAPSSSTLTARRDARRRFRNERVGRSSRCASAPLSEAHQLT